MYLLTEYSEEELQKTSEAYQESINSCAAAIKHWEDGDYEIDQEIKGYIEKLNRSISIYREMNVRALTALQIVRDRNLVTNS